MMFSFIRYIAWRIVEPRVLRTTNTFETIVRNEVTPEQWERIVEAWRRVYPTLQ